MLTALVLAVAVTAPAEPGASDRARVKAALALASASQRSAPVPAPRTTETRVGACGNPSCTCGCLSGEVCRCAEKSVGKVIAQSSNGWRWNADGRYWWKPVTEATPEELAKYSQRIHFTPSVQQTWTHHQPVQTWTEVIPEGTRRWEQSSFVPVPTYSAPVRSSGGSGC